MTKRIDMWMDLIDRTRELLQYSKEQHDDIAAHTGVDKSWIDHFNTCSDESARREDASLVERLHDWLVVLELAQGTPRFGPDECMLRLGEAAVYLYRQRQVLRPHGMIFENERTHILRAAESRLAEMRGTEHAA